MAGRFVLTGGSPENETLISFFKNSLSGLDSGTLSSLDENTSVGGGGRRTGLGRSLGHRLGRDLDFLGALSTLFNSTDTHLEHSTDMPCPMCASALVANLLGASAVGTAGGVAALKMKDKTRKVKSKPKPKTAKAK